MAKEKPIITHTEILCLAIRHLENETNRQRKYYSGIPECRPLLENLLEESTSKLKALKELYRIETGTEYGG